MKALLYISFKILFILLLFIVFIVFFGIPSFEKYLEGRTIFTEDKVFFSDSDSPEIIVNPLMNLDEKIPRCIDEHGEDFKLTRKCIEEVSKSKEDLLNSQNHSIENWKETFGPFWRARAYVKELNLDSSYTELEFQTDFINIDMFDPRFYMVTEKVLAIPRLMILLEPNKSKYINIQVTKMEILRLYR